MSFPAPTGEPHSTIPPDVHIVAEWIAAKGVAIWPSAPYDPQDPEGQRQLAEWFSKEVDDLNRFVREQYPNLFPF